MFTTSLTAALVSGLMASASLDTATWRTSYRAAASAATEARKPIAVFITAGSPGRLVKGEGLGKDAAKLLRDNFIPLTIDTSTAAGLELAKSFNMTEGLVISDRSGGVQALRHTGAVTEAELKAYLEQFSATTAAAATTEYRGAVTVQPRYYHPQSVYQPQYSQPRPVLNALQNVGGFVQNVGANALHNVGGFVQNVGGFMSGST